MDQAAARRVVVETGLEEFVGRDLVGRGSMRIRHARARFVAIDRSETEPPPLPIVGEPWCALTVRARLERMGETYRRLPHTPDTKPQQPRSCMPEPKRELFKDRPPEDRKRGVTDVDLRASNQVVDALTSDERATAWAIANRWGDRKLGRAMRCDGKTAAKRKQDVLVLLVAHWNGLEWRPDLEDVKRAKRFIHRNVD